MKTYKLIHETGTARFYQLANWSTYAEHDEQKEPYQYVVISDGTTHIERLAFSFEFMEGAGKSDLVSNKRGIFKVDYMHLCGDTTFMIYGGDIDSVYPDEWYLDKITERGRR